AGDYRRVDEYFARILELLAGDRFRERCGLAGYPSVMSRFFWTMALAERGEFDRGVVESREGIRLAEALDHPYSLTGALLGLGRLQGARGNFDDAIHLLERALALARDRHIPQLAADVSDPLGHLYAVSGRVADGLPLLQDGLKFMEAMGMFQWRT